MAIISGIWTIRGIENEAGWQQGLSISGSDAHDGIHTMTIGTELQGVSGQEVTVSPKAFKPGSGWIDCLEKEQTDWVDTIGLVITIFSDDNPPDGDRDFNDLVVQCIPHDKELKTPHEGLPRPDLTIPEQMVIFGR
jgi:hypothetical protein